MLKKKKKTKDHDDQDHLEPQGPSFLEKRNQSSINMRSHNSIHGPYELPADEDDGDWGRGGSNQPHQSSFNVFASGVMV